MSTPTRKIASRKRSRALRLLPLASLLLAPWLLAASMPQAQPTQAAQSQAPALQAQQPKISTESKIVTVYAAVHDKHGKIISDLNKQDFALQEDSRPQSISYFTRDTDLPLTLGLLVDTSLSQRHVLSEERSASYAFLDRLLRPDKDKAFLIHFDREVELLQDLTSSAEKLKSALALLQPSDRDQDLDGDRSPGRHHGGTQLYDAIYLACNEIMKKQQGRKALIVLTDGNDRGSKEPLEGAVEAAERTDTLVYAVYFAGDQPRNYPNHGGWSMGGPGGRPGGGGHRRYPEEERSDGKKVLERISRQTGGRIFEASKKETIDKIYADLDQELRSQYSLAYTPDRADPGAGYHRIQVAVDKKDLLVQAREGYYAEK
jgi:VWFA-related protein